MSTLGQILPRFNAESQEGASSIRTRGYFAGQNATLESLDLELGDNLRAGVNEYADDSNYEIIGKPRIERSKKLDQRVALVTGLKELLLKDSDGNEIVGSPWSELIQSRNIKTFKKTKTWTITLTGAVGAVRPLRQQTYNDITKAGIFFKEPEIGSEPEIVHVSDVTQVTRNISHVTIVLEGIYGIVV